MSKKETPDSEKMNLVFGLLHNFVNVAPAAEALNKERKQIDALVDTIYRHRLKLCNRAGLDFEDRDLEGIVDAYEQMNCLVARLMYEQGRLDRTPSTQE